MKKSKAETAETRKRIVRVAAQAFRSNGIHATGIAEIMSAAGLTHGGFYRHFASKEQLVAEACAVGMESTLDMLGAVARSGEGSFIEHFETYLLEENGDDCLAKCPLVAMGSELVRADLETRRAATNGYRELVGALARESTSGEGDAVFAFSAILGAITLSQIVDDPELAKSILVETKQRLARLWQKASAINSGECGSGDENDAFIGKVPSPIGS
jgi:TetR/AcrR family transcriptional regulator, transcriptional repressor for nem operon